MTPNMFIYANERSGSTLLSALLSEHPDIGVLNDSQMFRMYNDLCTPVLERLARKGVALGLRTPPVIARKDADRMPSLDTTVSHRDVVRFYSALATRYLGKRDSQLPRWQTPYQLQYFSALDARNALDRVRDGGLTLRELFEDVFRQLTPNDYHSRSIRGEKSPPHTYISPALRREYPDAAIVTLVRHPYTHVASLLRRNARSIDAAIAKHRSYYDRRFAFIYEEPDAIVVRYEDLVQSPTEQLGRIHKHLGLAKADVSDQFTYYTRSNYVGSAIDPSRDVKLLDSLDESQRSRVRRKCAFIIDRFYRDGPY